MMSDLLGSLLGMGQASPHASAAISPQLSSPKDVKANTAAAKWITSFNQFIQNKDIRPPRTTFFHDSYWRDHLCLSWDFHTWHGPDQINFFLRNQPKGCRLRDVSIDLSDHRKPELTPLDDTGNVYGILVRIKVETDVGTGKGLARLLYEVESQRWKAYTLYTALYELRGHAELRRPLGFTHRLLGTTHEFGDWRKVRYLQESFRGGLEPTVLIIGAGEAGLICGARLAHLDISSMIIEQNERVGDCWRNRYRRFALNDPVWYNHMPYLPFPDSWPVFTPKDKLAEWMESYAQIMELNVWSATTLQQAKWNGKCWSITIECHSPDGTVRTRLIRPRHIIQATGVSGEPIIPQIEGMNEFPKDGLCHSSQFSAAWSGTTGKRVVVVGSGDAGHDIAREFYENGHEVTMIQRSATCVDQIQDPRSYPETEPPTEEADLMTHSVPLALSKIQEIRKTKKLELENKEFFEGLKHAGFRVDKGPDGAGRKFKYLQRAGGSYINVGVSQLIIKGDIKIKQGQVVRINEHALLLDDGTELPADQIIFATGYAGMLETTKKIFGAKFADRLKEVWGLDEEGELKSVWRRSGHPGFWFAGGDLALCRYYSRMLALQIKAIENDLMRYEDL